MTRMTTRTPPTYQPLDESVLEDLLTPVIHKQREILRVTIVVGLLATLFVGVYYVRQKTRRTVYLQFKAMFAGATGGRYPNGLAFNPTDVVSSAVVDEVYDANDLSAYCPRPLFHSSLTVLEDSPALQRLTLDYQSRLVDPRLSAVDRDKVEADYVQQRTALGRHFRLLFVQPLQCAGLPRSVLFKALSDVLVTWSNDAEARRGVATLNLSVLTPVSFGQTASGSDNLLIRAWLVREDVRRVITNIGQVEALPGADFVRGGQKALSFVEIQNELEDMVAARVDPLIAAAARVDGTGARLWAERLLSSATSDMTLVQRQADVYRAALHDYSAQPPLGIVTRNTERTTKDAEGTPGLAPIEGALIDRLSSLSASDQAFRQELTRKALDASMHAVRKQQLVDEYRELLSSLGTNESGAGPVAKELSDVTAQAAAVTQQFDALCAVFSRASLGSGSLYLLEQPPIESTVRGLSSSTLALLIIAAIIATPITCGILLIVRDQLRKLRSHE